MWLGWVLSLWLVTADDKLVAYKVDRYNYRNDCIEAKEYLKEQLEADDSVKTYSLVCKSEKQQFQNNIIAIKG